MELAVEMGSYNEEENSVSFISSHLIASCTNCFFLTGLVSENITWGISLVLKEKFFPSLPCLQAAFW